MTNKDTIEEKVKEFVEHFDKTQMHNGIYDPARTIWYEKLYRTALTQAKEEGAREEAYKWFDSWYAYYINDSLVGKDHFPQWACKRLQSHGAEIPQEQLSAVSSEKV